MQFRIPKGRSFASAALAATLASCATTSGGPPPPQSHGPAPQMDRALAAQAIAFESYTRRAGAIPATFSGPPDVLAGLRTGAAYEPKQLEQGMIAYAALAALQEPAFVAGVRRAAQGPGGRDLARRLAANPELALDLPGGGAAAGRANAALYQRGAALQAAGQNVRKTSYSMQRQAWSKARVPNAGERLASVKRISTAGYRATDGDADALNAALAASGRRGGASPVIARGLAVAALSVMGQNGQARAVMNEPRSGMCLKMAKLNFHQCVASAGTHYEDVYCLGLHAMMDPGQCVVDATKPAPSGARRVAAR